MGRRRSDDGNSEPRNPPRTEPISPRKSPPAELPALADKSARVAWIVERMRELSWPGWPESLKFRQRLAEVWGVSESTVRDYSAEAHRVVELDPIDKAQVAQDIARTLDAVAQDALATVNEVTGLPDYGSAIRALEAKAKFLGAEPATKVNVSGTVTLEDLRELKKRIDGGEGGGGGGGEG